jgi:hypothetical protein
MVVSSILICPLFATRYSPLTYRPVQLCHMPSSNTARFAARKSPLAASITSVGVTVVRADSGNSCSPASTRAA